MIRLVCIDDPSLIYNDLALALEITKTFNLICTTKDLLAHYELHITPESEDVT